MFYVRRTYLFRLVVPVLEGVTCSLTPSRACLKLSRHILPLPYTTSCFLYNARFPLCQILLYEFLPFCVLHLHCIDFVFL